MLTALVWRWTKQLIELAVVAGTPHITDAKGVFNKLVAVDIADLIIGEILSVKGHTAKVVYWRIKSQAIFNVPLTIRFYVFRRNNAQLWPGGIKKVINCVEQKAS